jgi:hypothetical protein
VENMNMARTWSRAMCAAVLGACMLCVSHAASAYAGLPARGLELVSPAGKGADIDISGSARAAKSGGVVAYQSFGRAPGATTRGFFNQFLSLRAPSGWSTRSVTTPLDPIPSFSTTHHLEAVAQEANAGLGSGWGSQDAGHPQMLNLWRWDADGSFALVSQPSVPVSPEDPRSPTFGAHFAGGSDDLQIVVFRSSRALTADAPFDPGEYLYQWFDGELRLVNVLEDDSVVPSAVLGYALPAALYPGEYAVSKDGTRAFFTTKPSIVDPEREIYRRVDDPRDGAPGTTLHVSASERTDCAGDPSCGGDGIPNLVPDPDGATAAALFQLASADGSHAFFASPRKLTDDATASNADGLGVKAGDDFCAFTRCDLYRWDADAPEGERLTDLTIGDPAGGGVVATVGASEDGTRVYFVAGGTLAPGAVPDQPNLYLWDADLGVRLVATLDGTPVPPVGFAADRGVWDHALEGLNSLFRDARVTADGRYLAFLSRHASTGYDTAGHAQLYRFDADSDVLSCVSCNPRVQSSTGDAFVKRRRTTDPSEPWYSRNVSTDGRVVFDSAEALVQGDSNGRIDVYEWADDGLQLLSSGHDDADSSFLDASADGGDVFFTARAQLLSQDVDGFVDLYDARIGGGIAGSPPPPPECQGDSCQGAFTPVPERVTPATETFAGQGNVGRRTKPRPLKCKRGFQRKRVRGKVRCVKKPSKRRLHRSGRR